MISHIFINGKFFTGSRARVTVKDRGFLYGDGLFETLRSFKGSVFMLDPHLNRLFHSMKVLKYDIHYDKEYIKDALKKTITRNGLSGKDAYIKIIVTRGIHRGELHFRGGYKANLIIIADALNEYPEKDYTEGIKIISSSIRRTSLGNPIYSHKLLNYFENIFAKDEAYHNKAQEAIFLTGDHLVLEGASSNVFYVKRSTVYTPPLTQNILPGITRQTVIDLCGENRIGIRQKKIHYRDIINADEIFKTSSVAGIVPVKKIDRFVLTGKVPGSVTARLMVSYMNKVRLPNLH